MPRRKIIHNGGYYHIYNRGSKKMFLFNDDWDCNYFLTVLGAALRNNGNALVSYCLMPNHFHLLIKAKSCTSLAKMMHTLCLSYAVRYNKKYNTSGHVFQGRYRSKWVTSKSYLVYLSRYIHRNPAEAGLIDIGLLESFQWSSFPKYLGLIPKSKVKLDLDCVMDNFTNTEDYKDFCLVEDVPSKTWVTDLYWTPGRM